MTSLPEYYALRPADFGPIVSLTFSQSEKPLGVDGAIEKELRLVLSKCPDLSGDRLVLQFQGVSGLRFEQSSLSLANFGGIALRECEEGFQATEEEDRISFYFRAFEVSVESAHRSP